MEMPPLPPPPTGQRGGRAKTRQRLFYDEFYAMPIKEQAIVLRVLDEHHFFAKRMAARAKDVKEDDD